MEVFVAAVEAGNFSSAANRLGISSVMVGKHIVQLETLLNTRLLHRSTRKQQLTEAGARFYESARTVLEQVRAAESSIEDLQSIPRGLLRVSAPVTLGSCAIAPAATSYLEQFPGVRVDLVLSNSRVDLIDGKFDLAVRIGHLQDSQLVARPLRPYRMIICASPSYFDKHGTPVKMEDLSRHRCLTHTAWKGRHEWHVDDTECAWPTNTHLASNDGHAIRAAALAGAGVIVQPEVLVRDDIDSGRLVPVLQLCSPPARPVNLVYLRDNRPRPKLMSLVNWLLDTLG